MNKKNIAIIGAGIGSAYTAHKLKNKYNITVFEKTNRFGGDIDYHTIKNKEYSISTVFINIFFYPLLCMYANKLKLQSVYFPISLNVKFPSLYQIFKIMLGYNIYILLWIINYFYPLLFNKLTINTLYNNWITHEFFMYYDEYDEAYGEFTEDSKINSNIGEKNISSLLTYTNPLFILNMVLDLFLPINLGIYPNGFYTICEYFLRDVNILYNQDITCIDRKDKISIVSNNQEYTFDYLFIGCLPHFIYDKINDFEEKEKPLVEPVFHNNFYTILINTKHPTLKPLEVLKDHHNLKIRGITQLDSDVYLLASNCEDTNYLQDNLMNFLKDNNFTEIVNTEIFNWKIYASYKNMKNLYKLEKLQGYKNTFYVGKITCLEFTELIVQNVDKLLYDKFQIPRETPNLFGNIYHTLYFIYNRHTFTT
jgi:hypothetical protein